jgi:hypothetical protein
MTPNNMRQLINIVESAGLAGSVTTVPVDGTRFLHGSSNPNLTLDAVEIIRSSGQRQAKRGRVYGGFYMTSANDLKQALGYANMGGNKGFLYDVVIRPGTMILRKDGDITRLSPDDIKKWVDEGYGVVAGKSPLGQTEYVVIDKSVIQSLELRKDLASR